MNKPRILLSGNEHLENYAHAVELAGGIPDARKLPPVDLGYDGLILCGGNDIDPAFYGEAICGAVKIHKERDDAEFALAQAYIQAGKPVFGICRGCQLLNIYFGGTLYQHLEDAHIHTNQADYALSHLVTAIPGGLLHRLYGSSFCVNTYHHQGIRELGKGLKTDAVHNSLTEAFTHESLPVLAVQWHPEQMCSPQQESANGLALFHTFVELCKKETEKR